MALSTWLTLVMISALGAMVPGPSLAMIIRSTVGGSRLHGIVSAWAHALGIAIYALLSVVGLAVVVTHYPLFFNAITLAGASYLAWLGICALRSSGRMAESLTKKQSLSLVDAFRDGLAISILNPKILLFFLALFSQFVSAGGTPFGRSLIVFTPMVIDGLWYTLVAMGLSHSKVLPKLHAKAALIDKISGCIFLLLAGRVIWQVLTHL